MQEFRRKLEDVLYEKFGVEREFSAQLMPLLEAVARTRPAAAEWERLLVCVAAAHRSRAGEVDALDASRGLIGQFVTELKRMDESLQVLAAYLERMRETLRDPNPTRTVH